MANEPTMQEIAAALNAGAPPGVTFGATPPGVTMADHILQQHLHTQEAVETLHDLSQMVTKYRVKYWLPVLLLLLLVLACMLVYRIVSSIVFDWWLLQALVVGLALAGILRTRVFPAWQVAIVAVPTIWFLPMTGFGVAVSLPVYGMVGGLVDATHMTAEAAFVGVAAAARAIYPESYVVSVMLFISVLSTFNEAFSFTLEIEPGRTSMIPQWRPLLHAAIQSLRSDGLDCTWLQMAVLDVTAYCAPEAAVAITAVLIARAVARRPRRARNHGNRVNENMSEHEKRLAWEEEEVAALADLRDGCAFQPARSFGPHGDSYLHVACRHGDKEAFGRLVRYAALYDDSYGPSSHRRNKRGQTALHLAAQSGAPDMIRLLLGLRMGEYRPFVNDIDGQDKAGYTPLHYAASEQPPGADGPPYNAEHDPDPFEACRVLLEHGCHTGLPAGEDEEGETPLAIAVRYGELRTVQLLCSYGACLWWHRQFMLVQGGPSEAEQLAAELDWDEHQKMQRWLEKHRTSRYGPLHCLEVLTKERMRGLLRLCDERPVQKGYFVRAVGRAKARIRKAQARPEILELAEYLVRGAAPWNPKNHELYPRGARQRAVALRIIGEQLARRHSGSGQAGGYALLDVWVSNVMPGAIERHRYGIPSDAPHSAGEDELLHKPFGCHDRTRPKGLPNTYYEPERPHFPDDWPLYGEE